MGRMKNQAAPSDREIVTRRLLEAPREQVFDAFADPNRLTRWWGPKGFTSTFHEFDLRPGGVWRFVLHGPNGADYQNESVFVEVVKLGRIVFNHVSRPRFQMTLTLDASARTKTTITWRMLYETADECAKVRVFAVDANEQNLDRLEAELARIRRAG
jgi:uncharacterized protein YndB with AHSA1/START domain